MKESGSLATPIKLSSCNFPKIKYFCDVYILFPSFGDDCRLSLCPTPPPHFLPHFPCVFGQFSEGSFCIRGIWWHGRFTITYQRYTLNSLCKTAILLATLTFTRSVALTDTLSACIFSWTKSVKIVQRKPSTYGLIKTSLMAIQLYYYIVSDCHK